MSTLKRFALILVVLVLCVGCDQTTKKAAQSFLSETEIQSFLCDTVRLQLTHNQGVFLGLGSSLPDVWKDRLFILGVSAMLLILFAYTLLSKSISLAQIIAFALFLAGGIGNLIDRILYSGHVVDFINMGIGPIRTGIFNIADVAITVGELIFIAGTFPSRIKSN